MTWPDFGRDLPEQLRLHFEQSGFKQRAEVSAESFDREQIVARSRPPYPSVRAQAATRDEIMDVRMKDQRARPGVQHAQHAQLGAEPAGIAGQILQGLGAGREEQVQGDLRMGADKMPQAFRHRKGHQEVRHRQEQPRPLADQPVVGVGLSALRTMPVVAGMIAVVRARAVRTLEKLAAQSRRAARQDLVQDLPLPRGHGGTEASPVIRRQAPEQLMNRQTLTTVAGGGSVHPRLLMNSSSRF